MAAIPERAPSSQAGIGERAFGVLALLFLSDAFIPLVESMHGRDITSGDHDPYTLVTFYGIYAATAYRLSGRWRDVLRVVRREKLYACLLALAFLSAAWSDFPGITLRRSVGLLGTSLFGVYLAVRYPFDGQLRILGVTLGLVAVLSLLFAVCIPSYGIAGKLHEGAWRGVFVQKNNLGRMMALAVLVFALVRTTGKETILRGFLLVLSSSLLFLSTSKTSLAVLLAMASLWPLCRSLGWHRHLRTAFACFAVVAAVPAAVLWADHQGLLLGFAGRDSTFSGRTELWQAVWSMIEKEPVLGYGYNAFWIGLQGKAHYVWERIGWMTPHSHNGFLDLWLNVGIAGVAVFLAGLARAFRNSARLAGTRCGREHAWPLMYLAFFVLCNLTESALVKNNILFTVLYVSIVHTFHAGHGGQR